MRHHCSTINSIIWCFVVDGGGKCSLTAATLETPISVQLGWDLLPETSAYGFHAHKTIQWPLVPCGWGHCHPVGGLAMVAKVIVCPAFLYMTLSIMVCYCLINARTTPVWKHLLSIYFVSIPHLLKSFHYFGSYLYIITNTEVSTGVIKRRTYVCVYLVIHHAIDRWSFVERVKQYGHWSVP